MRAVKRLSFKLSILELTMPLATSLLQKALL